MSTSATASTTRRSIFLGVDVGTGSARAGLFDESGKLLGSASSPIQIWKERGCVEQSSTDIWHAICAAVKSACSLANVSGEEVVGMGFAATCSLVAVDADGDPVSVSWSGDSRRNVIVWMDHRAVKQTEKINSSNSPVLQYCGGALSPEMQLPKVTCAPSTGHSRVDLDHKSWKTKMSSCDKLVNVLPLIFHNPDT